MMLYVTQSDLEFLGSSDSVASVSQESETIGPNPAPKLTGSQSVNQNKIISRIATTIRMLYRKDCSEPVGWLNA